MTKRMQQSHLRSERRRQPSGARVACEHEHQGGAPRPAKYMTSSEAWPYRLASLRTADQATQKLSLRTDASCRLASCNFPSRRAQKRAVSWMAALVAAAWQRWRHARTAAEQSCACLVRAAAPTPGAPGFAPCWSRGGGFSFQELRKGGRCCGLQSEAKVHGQRRIDARRRVAARHEVACLSLATSAGVLRQRAGKTEPKLLRFHLHGGGRQDQIRGMSMCRDSKAWRAAWQELCCVEADWDEEAGAASESTE